jgi:DDE superfamily endonuclease
MVISIRGGKYWLWRAVDNEGEVLDFLAQRRRDAQAARKLMVKLLKKHGFAPNMANRIASARSTKIPPQRPHWSRTTQFPRLFCPIRNGEDLELDGGSACLMAVVLGDAAVGLSPEVTAAQRLKCHNKLHSLVSTRLAALLANWFRA